MSCDRPYRTNKGILHPRTLVPTSALAQQLVAEEHGRILFLVVVLTKREH